MKFSNSTAALIRAAVYQLPVAAAQGGGETLYEWFTSINPAMTDLIQAAGMVDLLNGTTSSTSTTANQSLMTLFAPTEEAFMSINSRVREYLADPLHVNVLQDILEGHVLPGKNLTSSKLFSMKGQNVTLMNNDTFSVAVTRLGDDAADSDQGNGLSSPTGDAVTQQQEDSVIQIDGATVTQQDAVYASNGMGHAINRVLGILSLVDMMEGMSKSGALPVSLDSILEANADTANVAVVKDQLENAALTLFAPNTAAFLIFGFANPEFATAMKDPAWFLHTASLLANHLTQQGVVMMQEDFAVNGGGVELTMMNQESLYIKADTANGPTEGSSFAIYPSATDTSTVLATVDDADILAYEGVVHMIDQVLLPEFMERTVMDVIRRENPTLAAMLELLPDLVTSLEEVFGVTVFLPSTEALAKADMALMNHLQSSQGAEMLATILNYHIVAENIPTPSMEDEMILTTGLGDDDVTSAATLKVQRNGKTIVIAGNEGVTATITKQNRLARNGLVHVMDTVLLPGQLPQIPMGSSTGGNTNNGGVNVNFNGGGASSGAGTSSSNYSLRIVAATMVVAIMSTVWAL
jgi:uncharacterized surface protein with fasciclin (FAS1) repeats